MSARLLDSGRVSVGVLSLMVGRPIAGVLNSTSSTPFSSAITASLCTTSLGIVAESEVLEPRARLGERQRSTAPDRTAGTYRGPRRRRRSRGRRPDSSESSRRRRRRRRGRRALRPSASALAVPTTMSAAAVPSATRVKRSTSPTRTCSTFLSVSMPSPRRRDCR